MKVPAVGLALEQEWAFATTRPLDRRARGLADGQHVVFVSTCYLEPAEGAPEASQRLRPVEVHVLVSGEYLLTLHQERMSLPELLAPDVPEGRSEKYVV